MPRSFLTCLSFCALALFPSCMSSTFATVAVAGAGAATKLPAVSALLGKDAPKPAELVGHSFDYSGLRRGADNVPCSASGSLLFGQTNPYVVRYVDGTSRSVHYARTDHQKGVITITTTAGVEYYRLTFTDGQQGSYTYERRYGVDFATGEGSFVIR